MIHPRSSPRAARRVAIGLFYLGLLLTTGSHARAAGQALVIGEAAYASLPPLPGCALSAHAIAAALRGLGFVVDEQDDGSSGEIYAAIGALTRQLTAVPQTPVLVYFCGYAISYEDRPFVLPVSAGVRRPSDALTQGLLAKTLLDAISGGKAATAVLALDAIPMPNGPAALPLDALTAPGLPPTLGYIAAITSTPGNTPTPMAAALVPLLHGPTVESGRLLSDIQQQLAGVKTASVAALHLPDAAWYLAGAPEPPPYAPPPVASPSPAAVPPSVAPPTAVPTVRAAKSLPDEQQMTDTQRRLIQRALSHLGYYDSETDGVFGTETRAAIRRWQHEVHAPMTGHLTAEEASKLATSWD
jgi:hypothetical protein